MWELGHRLWETLGSSNGAIMNCNRPSTVSYRRRVCPTVGGAPFGPDGAATGFEGMIFGPVRQHYRVCQHRRRLVGPVAGRDVHRVGLPPKPVPAALEALPRKFVRSPGEYDLRPPGTESVLRSVSRDRAARRTSWPAGPHRAPLANCKTTRSSSPDKRSE